jgi:tetratricopeptide (TPR) repeat protein
MKNHPASRCAPALNTLWNNVAGRSWVAFGLCVFAAILVYATSFSGELIWDDNYLVGENPFFKSPLLIFETFRHYLYLEAFGAHYRPIQNLSYLLDYWIWSGNPFGYHLTNAILHGLSGGLLYLVLAELLPGTLDGGTTKSRLAPVFAVVVSLTWVVHPTHNAAVAYISGRADSLASLFALLAWRLAIAAGKPASARQKVLCGMGAAASLLIAICSKEIALVWLLVFLLHLFFFEKATPIRRKIATVGAAALIVGVYAWLHSLPGPRSMPADASTAWDSRLLLMLRALGDYTRIMLFPARLTMDRTLSDPRMYAESTSWWAGVGFEWLSVLGLLALVASGWMCMRKLPGLQLRRLGASWFGVAFLPISNLFPLNAEVAEHWIYLASIGAILFLAGCAMALPVRIQRFGGAFAVAVILVLGVRTAVRSCDWVNEETFFQRTIAAGGGSPRVRNNLARIYETHREYEKQEQLLRETLRLAPDFVPARINLGACLANQGRMTEAEPLLKFSKAGEQALPTLFARSWYAALNLARLRVDEKRTDEALAILDEATTRYPDAWPLVVYESDLLQKKSGAADALPPVERYAAAFWWHEGAWSLVGRLRAQAGKPDEAIAALRQASRLDICDPKPLACIAEIELRRDRLAEAAAAQRAAIRRSPAEPSRYLVLAAILQKSGRADESADALQKARALSSEAGRKLL